MSSGSSKRCAPTVVRLEGERRAVSREVAAALRDLEGAGISVVSAGVRIDPEDRPGFYAAPFLNLPTLELEREELAEAIRGGTRVRAAPGAYKLSVHGVVMGAGRVGEDGVLRVRLPRKYARLRLW
ncbi:MAG: hypothetical protein ABGY09_02365 [Euryarchaeota archaeon]